MKFTYSGNISRRHWGKENVVHKNPLFRRPSALGVFIRKGKSGPGQCSSFLPGHRNSTATHEGGPRTLSVPFQNSHLARDVPLPTSSLGSWGSGTGPFTSKWACSTPRPAGELLPYRLPLWQGYSQSLLPPYSVDRALKLELCFWLCHWLSAPWTTSRNFC